jgi:hypothetical protein
MMDISWTVDGHQIRNSVHGYELAVGPPNSRNVSRKSSGSPGRGCDSYSVNTELMLQKRFRTKRNHQCVVTIEQNIIIIVE